MTPTMTAKWLSVLYVDLDHTVLRGPFSWVVFEQACGEIARKSGLRVEKVRERVKQENLRRQQDPTVDGVKAMDWDDIVRTIAARLEIELDINIVELVQSQAGSDSLLLEHADQVIRQLQHPRRAIVASTNGLARYQMPVLKALGLDGLFDDILTPDTHNVLKGKKAFYGQWPMNSELQVAVRDDLEWDIDAPQRLGFKAILKNGKQSHDETAEPFHAVSKPIQPDAVIDLLDELPEIVDRLEREALSDPNRKRKSWWNVSRRHPSQSRPNSV